MCNGVKVGECDNLPLRCARDYTDVSRVREPTIVEAPRVRDNPTGTGSEHTRPATIIESLGLFLL